MQNVAFKVKVTELRALLKMLEEVETDIADGYSDIEPTYDYVWLMAGKPINVNNAPVLSFDADRFCLVEDDLLPSEIHRKLLATAYTNEAGETGFKNEYEVEGK